MIKLESVRRVVWSGRLIVMSECVVVSCNVVMQWMVVVQVGEEHD